jgi:hypothetical protein
MIYFFIQIPLAEHIDYGFGHYSSVRMKMRLSDWRHFHPECMEEQ